MVKRNVYAKIAELYGLTLDEVFFIRNADPMVEEVFAVGKITENGFKFSETPPATNTVPTWVDDSDTVVRILSGELLVKGEWKPAEGDIYYFIHNSAGSIRKTVYNTDETLDALNIGNGNFFKTLELAESQKERVIANIFSAVNPSDEENSDLTE